LLHAGGAICLTQQLTVYTRRGCHLCDDMMQALERLRPELGFQLLEVDIDTDPGLRRRYDTRVPVLAAGEVEICDYFLEEVRLRAHLKSGG
jgi:glutaredoxin